MAFSYTSASLGRALLNDVMDIYFHNPLEGFRLKRAHFDTPNSRVHFVIVGTLSEQKLLCLHPRLRLMQGR